MEVFSIMILLLLHLPLFFEALCNCDFWKVLYKYEFPYLQAWHYEDYFKH